MIFRNKTIQRLTSSLIIFSIFTFALFLSLPPKQANAQFNPFVFDIPTEFFTAATATSATVDATTNVVTTGEQIWQVAKQAFNIGIQIFEAKLLQKITQNTVNWINTGFSGNPLYIQNAGSFFTDIAKLEIKTVVNDYGYDPAKFPFGKDFALNTINAYKRQASDNAAYTLSSAIKDPVLLNQYQNNFDVGGWNGFLTNTQYPQNNYLGFTIMANNELAQRLEGTVQNKAQQVQSTLQQGLGFLSPKTCSTNPDYNTKIINEFQPPSFNDADYRKTHAYPTCADADSEEDCKAEQADWQAGEDQYKADNWDPTNVCPNRPDGSSGLVATTPGSVIGNQISRTLTSSISQTELGKAVGGSISSIVDALVNHFMDKGLNALTSVVNQAPVPDNWSYFGNNLGGTYLPYGSGSPSDPANPATPFAATPTSVSVTTDSEADVTLSGGTAPYGIVTQPNSAMAIGFIYDTTLGVIGTGATPGQTSIVVADSAGKTISIQITATGGITTMPPVLAPLPPPPPTVGTPPPFCTTDNEGVITCSSCTTDSNGATLCQYTTPPPSAPGGGSGVGCEVKVGTGTPPANVSDITSATIVGNSPTDVLSWPVTTTITNVADNEHMTFDKEDGGWPDVALSAGDSDTGYVNYTYWLFLNINGQWVGSGFIQRWNGETDGPAGNSMYYQLPNEWYYGSQWAPMTNHALKIGEQVGFMVTSGNARNGFSGSVKERSQIYLMNLPPTPGVCTPHGGTPTPTPTPEPTPTPAAPGDPVITSVSPASTTAGTTTLTIVGTNLTSTVQFFDGSGGRTTVVGAVNSGGTQTAVLVPASLPSGNATVKIYKNATSVSNGKLIQVNGGGVTPVDVTATIPSFDSVAGSRGQLAYNTAQNNWLVTGALDQVSGRIMANDGTPVTPEFKINSDSGVQVLTPKAAYASDLNKYLVVWIGFPDASGGTIYGRFVNADGSLSGNPFVVFKDPAGGASFLYTNSVLRYDLKNKRFVFVWEYRDPYIGVNLITINQSGAPSAMVAVARGVNGNNYPSLAINEGANEYCVAYDKRSDSPAKIAVKKINAATLAVGAETTLSSLAQASTIAYNSSTNQYMLGWDNFTGKSMGRILKTCDVNNVSGSTFTMSNVGGAPSLSYNSKSNNYGVIVQDQADSGNSYSILNSSGGVLSKGISFAGGFGNFLPTIAPNLTDGSFAAISSIEYKTTKFAPNLKP